MKLFHKIPAGYLLKTGINISSATGIDLIDKWYAIYFVKVNFGFIGIYFGRFRKTKRWKLSVAATRYPIET